MAGQIDTKYYQEIGRKIMKIREEKRLVQREVAKTVGVTFQQWQKYEKGTNRIPTKTLVIFCELTGADIKELTGCTVESYEKIYKEAVINYNNTVNNVYNYNGFFSNLFNMDLTLMKNKIVVGAVFISTITWVVFAFLKAFPDINSKYNLVFLSIQILVLLIAFAMALFAVFGYSLLTYGITYIAYICLYSIAVRFMEAYYSMVLPVAGLDRVIMYITAFVLTFLTFYILRKCKINLNSGLQVSKTEA